MATKATKSTKAEKPAKTPKTEKAAKPAKANKAPKAVKAPKAEKAVKAAKSTVKRGKKAEETAEPEILATAAVPEPESEPTPAPEAEPQERDDAELTESHDEEPSEEAAAPETAGEAVEEDEAAAETEPETEEAGEDEVSEQPSGPAPRLERLQKILAAAGVASRRHAEELITGGRVQVNGQTVTVLGSKADPARDHIRVDGKLLQGAERQRYFMLHKPKGYVTTVSDPEGRPTVMEFFTKAGERLYPVGRLDYLSEGLLLVTNDGELANALTKASSRVEKTYLDKVAGQPREEELDRLREGVSIDRTTQGEGKVRTAPARVRQVRVGENPWFEVVLIEGRNRELRKMFEEIGHHVEKIRRVGYGPLVLDVPVGKTRPLDPDEVQALRLTAAGKLKPKRLKTRKMLPRDAGKTVVYEDKEKPRSRPARPFGTRPPQPESGPREGGFAPKREGGFAPRREGGFAPRREGGFARREGGFAPRREGSFPKREGGFAKREGGFAPRSDRPARREGGFAPRREGGFAPKREGGFAKREGGFAPRREGGFPKRTGGFSRPDKPFRPSPDRAERPEGAGRGPASRGEEFRPHRGGNPRFGRPEGGRTGNPRDARGFRPDDRPQQSFRPSGERRTFDRPGAPRPDRPASPRSFTPKPPSRIHIDAVESDRPESTRPSSFGTGRPAFKRPGTGRPSGPARPPRGAGSSRPFTTSTGIPRAGGARPGTKPGRPGGFGAKPGGFKKSGGFKSGPNKGPGFKGKPKPGGKRGR